MINIQQLESLTVYVADFGSMEGHAFHKKYGVPRHRLEDLNLYPHVIARAILGSVVTGEMEDVLVKARAGTWIDRGRPELQNLTLKGRVIASLLYTQDYHSSESSHFEARYGKTRVNALTPSTIVGELLDTDGSVSSVVGEYLERALAGRRYGGDLFKDFE